MSKVYTMIAGLLQALSQAAQNAAGAAASLTQALCAAILGGCTVEDCIEFMQEGYEVSGNEFPAGMASNVKRLHALHATPEGKAKLAEVRDSGYALNNRLLTHFNVPKLTARGAKGKDAAADKDAPAANEPVYSRAAFVQYFQGMMAHANTIGLDTTTAEKLKDTIAQALALLKSAK